MSTFEGAQASSKMLTYLSKMLMKVCLSTFGRDAEEKAIEREEAREARQIQSAEG
jgi:hypothetical protein